MPSDTSLDCPCGRRWPVLVAVGSGTFLTALDSSVVNTVLPVIARWFGKDIPTAEWVVAAYLLGLSGLLVAFGRAGDLWGHRRVYSSGLLTFVAASAMCSLAWSIWSLVCFRTVQAIGGAMLMSNSPALLTGHFPARKRGTVLGIQATMTYLGLCAGPALGGLLADQLGWQSVFWVNVPVGLVTLALVLGFVPADRPSLGTGEPFDLRGAVWFLLGLIGLLVALNRAHQWGWWSAGMLLVSVLCLGRFIAVELGAVSPMLDLSLFRSWPLSAALASAMLNYMCVFTVAFLVPLYLVHVRGLPIRRTGAIMTVQPIVMAVAAPLSGTLSDRLGTRAVATPGMGLLAVALWGLSRVDTATSIGRIPAWLALIGLGVGLFVSPNNSAVLGGVPGHRRGIASGVLATARNLGMALGVGLAGAILAVAQARLHGAMAGTMAGIQAGLGAASLLAAVGAGLSAFRDYGRS